MYVADERLELSVLCRNERLLCGVLCVSTALFLPVHSLAPVFNQTHHMPTVLCNIVCNNCAQCNAHTYEQT